MTETACAAYVQSQADSREQTLRSKTAFMLKFKRIRAAGSVLRGLKKKPKIGDEEAQMDREEAHAIIFDSDTKGHAADLIAEDAPQTVVTWFHPVESWNVRVVDAGNCFVLRNVFTAEGQAELFSRSLDEYIRGPELNCNLDAEYVRDKTVAIADLLSCRQNLISKQGTKTLVSSPIMKRLRWFTIGYQYDWTSKEYVYPAKGTPAPAIPSTLVDVCRHMARVLGCGDKYKPEAGIINYYKIGDTLSAHQDVAEVNKEAPLFSISLGLSAVFLIGTSSLDDEPAQLLLQSGDVVVMQKDRRLAYHGVPVILDHRDEEDPVFGMLEPESVRDIFRNTRLNINVRQVH
eukprot:Clim_evm60s11 gene=Clim_evmTU60s11